MSGGSGESKEHGDASNTKEFKANDGDDVEGSEVIQFAVYCALYRLAHIAKQSQGDAMLDVIFVGLTAGFFLTAIAYVRLCEKLR